MVGARCLTHRRAVPRGGGLFFVQLFTLFAAVYKVLLLRIVLRCWKIYIPHHCWVFVGLCVHTSVPRIFHQPFGAFFALCQLYKAVVLPALDAVLTLHFLAVFFVAHNLVVLEAGGAFASYSCARACLLRSGRL